jgi:hypothetical protein
VFADSRVAGPWFSPSPQPAARRASQRRSLSLVPRQDTMLQIVATPSHDIPLRSYVWSTVCSFILLPHFPQSSGCASLTDEMKRRREETRHSSESLAEGAATLEISSTPRSIGDHPATWHALPGTRAKLINSALTVWFPRVHDARGMPWRKPFDASLSSEARGQRAYEVCTGETGQL